MINKLLFVFVFAAVVLHGLTSCTTCSRKNTDDFNIPDSIRTAGQL